jgi:hypothetical protein
MSSGDIGIQITLALEHPIRVGHTSTWPARVRRRDVRAGFEGLPGRFGVYQGQTLVGTREVFVFIVFGRAVPTRRQLRRANAELQRAHLG